METIWLIDYNGCIYTVCYGTKSVLLKNLKTRQIVILSYQEYYNMGVVSVPTFSNETLQEIGELIYNAESFH